MHFSTALTAAAAVVPALVQAHGGSPVPKIAGLHIADLKARDIFESLRVRAAAVAAAVDHPHEKRGEVEARQSQERCGPEFGSCASGYCCSGSGWCGTTNDYCYAPGCNYQYGPGCPDNVTPGGTNTSSVARPLLGSVPYGGGGFYNCIKPGTIAITYDDGPIADYTAHILDVFKSYGGKATFFVTGNNVNKGQIDVESNGHPAVIRRMNSEGHQIASHTWTHLDLSAISSVDRKNQMWKLEMAVRNILGFFPTYMRPPYSSCTAASGCESDMRALGYHVAYFDVDTDDYNQITPDKIQNSKSWFRGNITQGGATPSNKQWLGIAHDIHYQTAYNLTEYMLSTLTQLGYKAVTLGECLGDPKENWYRSSSGSTSPSSSSTIRSSTSTTRTSTAPSSTASKKVSLDATCGANNGGATCLGSTFGNCCSVAGWCGITSAYCGEGCQTGFGTCGSSSVSSSSRPVTSSSTQPVTSSTRTSSAATPSSTLKVSTDGTCGTGITCLGSTFGTCCSLYNWCGSTTDHCGTGCQSAFGTCSGAGTPPPVSSVRPSSSSIRTVTSTRTSTSTAPVSTLKVSVDGSCGAGVTCLRSEFGNCCSQYGYCGATDLYCGVGCQRAFGSCT